MSVLIEAGRLSIARVQVFILSADDASECVQWQRKPFVHVLAQPRVVLLAQTVFGPHRLLNAVSRVQARGHLDAVKIHIGTVSHLDRVNISLDSSGFFVSTIYQRNLRHLSTETRLEHFWLRFTSHLERNQVHGSVL